MINTPEKSSLNSSVFSPVRFLDSPSSITKSSRNDPIGIRDKIKSISKTIVDNHRKWDAAHLRGLTLCTQIERCKNRAMKNLNNKDENGAEQTLYPDEMKSPCDKLNIITTIFDDICSSAHQSKCEINSLINLGSESAFLENNLLFKTWNCKKMENMIETLCDNYTNEYKVKWKIMENIAHAKSLDELIVHLCAWEFQMFINSDIDILVKQLIVEADIELETKK